MSATEKLRSMLDERGVEWSKPSGLNSRFADSITFIENVAVVSEIDGSDLLRINFDGTPEQAIAATLGSERRPYEQRIVGDGSDWGDIMCDAFDNLMASACEACTPEQFERLEGHIRATLGSDKLTAEQVRETVEKHWHDLPAEYDMPEATALPEFSYDWQEIADELNAMLLNATCEYCNGSKKPVNAEIGNDALITLHAIGDEYISDGFSLDAFSKTGEGGSTEEADRWKIM